MLTSESKIMQSNHRHCPTIAHLLMITFSIAAFLAWLAPQLRQNFNFTICALNEVEIFSFAVGISCCWLGMGVALKHRVRFKNALRLQPGESMCVVEGACFMIMLLIGAAFNWLLSSESLAGRFFLSEASVSFFVVALAGAAFYIGWARKQSLMRWRLVGIAKAVAHIVGPLAMVAVASGKAINWYPTIQVAVLLVYVATVIVMLVAIGPILKKRQYRWTHWLGILGTGVIYTTRIATEVRLSEYLS